MMKRISKKINKLLKNRKKGFTLIESIVSIALFAIFGVVITLFVTQSSNFLNKSNKYDSQRTKIQKSFNSGKTSPGDYIINSEDENANYNGLNNKPGTKKIKGSIEIDTKNAKIYGPKQGKIGVENASNYNQELDSDNYKKEIKVVTVIVYDKDISDGGEPEEIRVIGIVDEDTQNS